MKEETKQRWLKQHIIKSDLDLDTMELLSETGKRREILEISLVKEGTYNSKKLFKYKSKEVEDLISLFQAELTPASYAFIKSYFPLNTNLTAIL